MQNFLSNLLTGNAGTPATNGVQIPLATPAPPLAPNSPIAPAGVASGGNVATPQARTGIGGIIDRATNFLGSEKGKSLLAAAGQIGAAIAPAGSPFHANFQTQLGKVGANLNRGDLFAHALSQPGAIDFNAIFANMFKKRQADNAAAAAGTASTPAQG